MKKMQFQECKECRIAKPMHCFRRTRVPPHYRADVCDWCIKDAFYIGKFRHGRHYATTSKPKT